MTLHQPLQQPLQQPKAASLHSYARVTQRRQTAYRWDSLPKIVLVSPKQAPTMLPRLEPRHRHCKTIAQTGTNRATPYYLSTIMTVMAAASSENAKFQVYTHARYGRLRKNPTSLFNGFELFLSTKYVSTHVLGATKACKHLKTAQFPHDPAFAFMPAAKGTAFIHVSHMQHQKILELVGLNLERTPWDQQQYDVQWRVGRTIVLDVAKFDTPNGLQATIMKSHV